MRVWWVVTDWFAGVSWCYYCCFRWTFASSGVEWPNIGIYYWINAKMCFRRLLGWMQTLSSFMSSSYWCVDCICIEWHGMSCGGTCGYCCWLLWVENWDLSIESERDKEYKEMCQRGRVKKGWYCYYQAPTSRHRKLTYFYASFVIIFPFGYMTNKYLIFIL